MTVSTTNMVADALSKVLGHCECPVLCILTRSPPAIVLHLYTILSIFGQPLTQTSKATHDTSTETHNTLTLTHDDSQHFNSNGDPQQNRLWDPSFYLKPSSSKVIEFQDSLIKFVFLELEWLLRKWVIFFTKRKEKKRKEEDQTLTLAAATPPPPSTAVCRIVYADSSSARAFPSAAFTSSAACPATPSHIERRPSKSPKPSRACVSATRVAHAHPTRRAVPSPSTGNSTRTPAFSSPREADPTRAFHRKMIGSRAKPSRTCEPPVELSYTRELPVRAVFCFLAEPPSRFACL
ncbi:hypothetical protein E6C27_scaffold319G00030 [Cucumis melo var. makuwa]|uniref:Uncharacterized protein n=1 Tax=Cucumis melo var. makuwa TaxID=1194695 RepID=A0A5A7ULE4_CUCMM|nr:hypothetical protein E6C27_scaffold319G00030 [Cucumis melo var. makuwa]